MESARGEWGSKTGFILAAAGSAIGLGNIWRFPYVAAGNGGAIFVLIYLGFVFLIGLAVMLAELTVGRHTEKNPFGAFSAIVPGSRWPLVGALGIITGVGILSFYGVIAGWTLGYIVKTISGEFTGISDPGMFATNFANFAANPLSAIFFLAVFIALTVLVVVGGVSKGIERWSRILMPVLFGLLILLAIRSLTLGEGVADGLKFYLQPDFSAVTGNTVMQALGQALFSLSLGMGTMITYGSYISKKENLVSAAAYVVSFDTLIAFLAGLVIFPALYALSPDPASVSPGPGLVFVVLPSLFDKIPGGVIFGTGFFFLLSIAALTSTVSLLEVPVAYLIDEKKWTRKIAAISTGVITFIIGIPSALSQGANDFLGRLPIVDLDFLSFMNNLFGNFALVTGGFFICLFVGWKWGINNASREVEAGGASFGYRNMWSFTLRFLAPLCIMVTFLYIALTGNFF